MTKGVKTELSLDAVEFLRTVLNISTSMKTAKTDAEQATDAVNKALSAEEKQAKEIAKFLNQNIQAEKKLRKETEKLTKEEKKRKDNIIKMQLASLKLAEADKKRTQGLLHQMQVMKKLGQLSMATYAVGRIFGYAKAIVGTIKEQEKMNTQMAVLEGKTKGWTSALKQAQLETKGLVKMHELLSAVNIAESMNLDFKPEEFTDLAKQGQRIAIKFSEPFDIALTKLMKGIGRGSKKLLDDLIPGFRDLEVINAEYAKSIGKETKGLTEQDKMMARKLEVLKQIRGISQDVTDDIIDQNLRLSQQIAHGEILWNQQKKMWVSAMTELSEYLGLIKSLKEMQDDRNIDERTKQFYKLLQLQTEGQNTEIIFQNTSKKYMQALIDLKEQALRNTSSMEYANLRDAKTTLTKLEYEKEIVALASSMLSAEEQIDIVRKARVESVKNELDFWYTVPQEVDKYLAEIEKVGDEYEKIDEILNSIKDEDVKARVEMELSVTGDGKALWEIMTGKKEEAISDINNADGIRGSGLLRQTAFTTNIKKKCKPDQVWDEASGQCVKKKKGRKAPKPELPDFDAYVKAYAKEMYGFDYDSDIVSKEAEEAYSKIEAEALRGEASGRKKVKGRIKSSRFDDGQDMLFAGAGMLDAKTIENMTKALTYQTEMREKGIEIDRESYIKELELAQEARDAQKQNRDAMNKDFLKSKKALFTQAKKMYNDDERDQIIAQAEALYKRRELILQGAKVQREDVINQKEQEIEELKALEGLMTDEEKAKLQLKITALEELKNINDEYNYEELKSQQSMVQAMQDLREMDTKLEKDYQKEKIAIQKSALEHMINISKELGNVAYEGLLRPASQAREQKELEMKIATINGATAEGLAEQQKLRDDFNAQREYEDSVWLDRAIGNALMTAGSQIYAQGITDLWKGGSDMFENPAKGALRMGYGALEVGVGAGLGYVGESMIPPSYQGRLEDDGQKDRNNLNNQDNNQEIHAFMFPSQRQFQMATVKANKGQRA